MNTNASPRKITQDERDSEITDQLENFLYGLGSELFKQRRLDAFGAEQIIATDFFDYSRGRRRIVDFAEPSRSIQNGSQFVGDAIMPISWRTSFTACGVEQHQLVPQPTKSLNYFSTLSK
jgi:hypothetical protein